MEIESYSFGKIKIDGEVYTEDVIILPDRIKDDWWRVQGHLVKVKDLKEVWEAEPEVIIIGRGAYGRMEPTPEVLEKAEKMNIEIRSKETEEACKIYNKLKDEKRVAAALHLTC